MKKALILGGNGFIGHHLAKKLKKDGYWIRTIDIKEYEYGTPNYTDDYILEDLTNISHFERALLKNNIWFDETYHLAAFMGGAGVIFSGKHDAQILHDNLMIDLNVAELCKRYKLPKVFYSSSACCYNQELQLNANNVGLKENMDYPAHPDSDYGFEKLMGERIFKAYARNYNLNIKIARFHNIFGPEGAWCNGKEKAPAAICRKIAEIEGNTGEIEIWGDGEQSRTFLYIDECVEGIQKLMTDSIFNGPVNIGSTELITINKLVEMVAIIANKNITIKHIDGPIGVRGRCSDNTLIQEKLGWKPSQPLYKGLVKTYQWIQKETERLNNQNE